MRIAPGQGHGVTPSSHTREAPFRLALRQKSVTYVYSKMGKRSLYFAGLVVRAEGEFWLLHGALCRCGKVSAFREMSVDEVILVSFKCCANSFSDNLNF